MDNKKQNNNKKGSPLKPKKVNMGSMMYWIYGLIIIGLGWIMISGGEGSAESKDIRWPKLEQILLNKDYSKVVVVNQEYAEIFINKDIVAEDSTYKDLRPRKSFRVAPEKDPFYTYKFVTYQSFEKDLERVSNEIIQRDTVGKSDTEKLDIIRNSRVDVTPETRESVWKFFLPLLWPILFIVLFIFLMNRMMRNAGGGGGGAGGGIFNIGKSKAQMYDKDSMQVKVNFNDVAGLEEAKVEIMEIVDFLKNPKKYTDLGGKIPKGALLVGPPGTGKTLLAKAVAGEAKVPFFSLSGSDFVEMFVGVGASRVRDLFAKAKEKAPCIIFIDEIDAIGRARGKNLASGSNDERENTLNQLLTEMDGFGTNAGVILLAATNRADILDSALLRPGRFDRQIYLELPDAEERKAIFKVHMRNLKLSKELDADFFAKQTPGFSGADIANVCNEAALIAARNNKKFIEKQDFLDAVDRIVGGLEKRTKIITPQEKKVIAYHEAGHASVSWMLRYAHPLVKVTIVPRGKSLGAAWYLPEERQITTYEQMMDEMTATLGGRASEDLVFGKISTGALNDLERVTKQAYAMVVYYGMNEKVGNLSYYDSSGQSEYGFTKPFSEKTAETIDEEIHAMIESAYERAKSILSENREKVDALANLLIEKEVIFREDLENIFGKRPFEEAEINKPESEIMKEEEKKEEIGESENAATE